MSSSCNCCAFEYIICGWATIRGARGGARPLRPRPADNGAAPRQVSPRHARTCRRRAPAPRPSQRAPVTHAHAADAHPLPDVLDCRCYAVGSGFSCPPPVRHPRLLFLSLFAHHVAALLTRPYDGSTAFQPSEVSRVFVCFSSFLRLRGSWKVVLWSPACVCLGWCGDYMLSGFPAF